VAAAGEQVTMTLRCWKWGDAPMRRRHRVAMVVVGCLVASVAFAGTQAAMQTESQAATQTAMQTAMQTDQKSTAAKTAHNRVAQPVGPAVDEAPKPAMPPAQLDLSASVIKSAVSAADEDYAPPTARGTPFGSAPIAAQAKVDRAFEAAQIGRCGGPDTLKFDPVPVWGDFVMGILAVPYVFKAMATGHCKF
jgi:hypothetical protein